jgi:iron(III) transport system substrate-binding protein
LRYIIIFILNSLFISKSFSLQIESTNIYVNSNEEINLRILSSTDIEVFSPILKKFSESNKNISIEYIVASTADIYDEIKNNRDSRFDLVMSSAMDLQIKLANDGYAKNIDVSNKQTMPNWSLWQDKVIGLSLEPIVMVFSKKDVKNIPNTRSDLISILRANSNYFNNRIITYDINKSGAGFLFASQDARQSNSFWRLSELMGSLNAKVVCCSRDMLNSIISRDKFIAYNIIGSYAEERAKSEKNLLIVYPSDYTLILLRSALIPITSKNDSNALSFLNFLLSSTGQNFLEKKGMYSVYNKKIIQQGNIRPIRLDTGLLVFLDKLKRKRFLKEWNETIFQ